MKRICAWCGTLLQNGPPQPISHGMCASCEQAMLWNEWLWDFQRRAIDLSDEELEEKHWSFYMLSQRCEGNERLLQCADVLLDEKFRRVRVEIEGC